MNRLRTISILCLTMWASAALIAPATRSVLLHVSLDPSPLVGLGSPPAPFYVEFQFNDGSFTLDAVNTVTLSNFQFGGGGPSGPPSFFSFGDISGDLSSTIRLR